MDAREMTAEVRKRMTILNISSQEMADVSRLHLRTWYDRMRDPSQFRLGELERMCRYVGLRITYEERKSK